MSTDTRTLTAAPPHSCSTGNGLCWRCKGYAKLQGRVCWHCRGTGRQRFADWFWWHAERLPGTLSEVGPEAYILAGHDLREEAK